MFFLSNFSSFTNAGFYRHCFFPKADQKHISNRFLYLNLKILQDCFLFCLCSIPFTWKKWSINVLSLLKPSIHILNNAKWISNYNCIISLCLFIFFSLQSSNSSSGTDFSDFSESEGMLSIKTPKYLKKRH